MLHDEKTIKQATRNLRKELALIGLELTHSATLNLLSRTLGYKDYNTLAPAIKDNTLLQEKHSGKINTQYNNNENIYKHAADLALSHIDDILLAESENDVGNILLTIVNQISDLHARKKKIKKEIKENPMNTAINVLNQVKNIPTSSQEMHNYINSLSEEEYASVSTVYIIGRDGWDRSQCDEIAQSDYMTQQYAMGIQVTQKMLDDKFLTSDIKNRQLQLTFEDELRSAKEKEDGSYQHNWLSLKTNLKDALKNGIELIQNI